MIAKNQSLFILGKYSFFVADDKKESDGQERKSVV